MSHVKIEISEQEIRAKYAEHVNEKIRSVTIGEMLKDESFKKNLIDNHLQSRKENEVPVTIQVR